MPTVAIWVQLTADWAGFNIPPTQYRLSGRQFYSSKYLTYSIKVLKEQTLQK